jgi:hypothetical protein
MTEQPEPGAGRVQVRSDATPRWGAAVRWCHGGSGEAVVAWASGRTPQDGNDKSPSVRGDE